MSFWASFIFLLLFSFLANSRASAQRPSYVYHLCSNTTPYSRNSHYFTNLKTLLSSLSSPKASYSTGFQNATAGQAPDRVTGLFLCRGDLSTEVCRSCVTFSVSEALTRCPNEREAVLYYNECMLRYSHQNILSTLTIHGGTIRLNNTSISSNQVDRFKELVSSTMNQAAQEAANSSTKFYTKKANWTVFQALYGLVQCTPDLTIQDCIDCLQESINGLHLDKIGGKLFWPSCSSRYELYAFYNQTTNKIPPASTPPRTGKKGNPNVFTLGICVAIIVAVLLSLTGYCLFAKCTKQAYNTATLLDDDKTAIESLQLDYTTIQDATNEFSESNKIGEGGFGEVYKGTLSNGMEVAVKKLSKSSKQGDTEFKNEVVVVARLQHRNLVRLLGFCLERGERILVYEYVPNKSLDYFLFDPAKQGQLDWIKRYNIIGGIARGILYLHQDSRFTIIHRDIKAGNILLDADMTPKVADFGMARIFGMDQTQEKTNKIAGTYGYMSPEYAMRGQFSMKSDVYSFGILVLEIISGRKVRSFYMTDGAHDLVTYAWRLWNRGTALALVDPIIVENCQKSEVVRCLHIGLICVQKDPLNRPTFSTICDMLTSNTITLPVPQQPGFFVQNRSNKHLLDSDQVMMKNSVPTSIDDASITELYPR